MGEILSYSYTKFFINLSSFTYKILRIFSLGLVFYFFKFLRLCRNFTSNTVLVWSIIFNTISNYSLQPFIIFLIYDVSSYIFEPRNRLFGGGSKEESDILSWSFSAENPVSDRISRFRLNYFSSMFKLYFCVISIMSS